MNRIHRFLAAALVAIAVIGAVPLLRMALPPGLPARTAGEALAAGDAADKRPNVEVSLPVQKTIYRKLNLPGEVLADQHVEIFARVPGYVESLGVDRGSVVKAGDVLAKVSVPDLVAQLALAKADRAAYPSLVARDSATLAWREAIWTRLSSIAAKSPNLINQETLDDAKGRYEIAKAELGVTQSKEAGLAAAEDRAQAMVDFAVLRAPFDGVVTDRWVDPGDLLQAGTTRMFRLVRQDLLRIRLHVPESDVPGIRTDSKAKITFDELPGKTLEGSVSRTSWALTETTKTVTVEIDLKNAEGLLRPGMFARVTLDLEARPNALVLPAGALVAEKKKMFVFIIKEGAARKTPIKVGFDDGIEFEVREGIDEKDEIVVTGKNLISDGDAVRTAKKP